MIGCSGSEGRVRAGGVHDAAHAAHVGLLFYRRDVEMSVLENFKTLRTLSMACCAGVKDVSGLGGVRGASTRSTWVGALK